jgi:hypothetical protein
LLLSSVPDSGPIRGNDFEKKYVVMGMENTPVEDLPKPFPQRDRRRGKRILTFRNARFVVLALIGVFVLVSLFFEFRPKKPGEFGRLYSRRTRAAAVNARQSYMVIKETNISDQVGADPMLLEAARRQQYLGVTDADIAAMRIAAQPRLQVLEVTPGGMPVLQQNSNQPKAKIEITGGPEGVYVKPQ